MNSKTLEPELSFILPVYNVSLYVAKCLNSILSQSEANFEVIIVDDGSTDSSLDICRSFSIKDERIRIYSQQNQGQGVARNLGIGLAKGKFIAFVDPDDWLDTRMMEISLRELKSSNADFLNFRLQFLHEDGKVGYSMPSFRCSNLTGEDIFEHALIDDLIYSSPCNKVYRKDFLINYDINFPSIRSYEDLLFSRVVAKNASYCIFIDDILYCALIRAGSTSRSISSESFQLAARVISLEEEVLFIQEPQKHIQDIYSAHVRKFLSLVILKAAFIMDSRKLFIEYVDILNVTLGSHPLNIKILKRLSLRGRLSILITIYPKVSWIICRLLKFLGYKIY